MGKSLRAKKRLNNKKELLKIYAPRQLEKLKNTVSALHARIQFVQGGNEKVVGGSMEEESTSTGETPANAIKETVVPPISASYGFGKSKNSKNKRKIMSKESILKAALKQTPKKRLGNFNGLAYLCKAMSAKHGAIKRLMAEHRAIQESPTEGIVTAFNPENVLLWDVVIEGPHDSYYENGVFRAQLKFPGDYPLSPPTMTFSPPVFHPNIYSDGRVCISILHPPGDDPTGYEHRNERWSPMQSIEKILLSVISMFAEPNDESSANLDAGKLFRDDRVAYSRRVDQDVRLSLGLS